MTELKRSTPKKVLFLFAWIGMAFLAISFLPSIGRPAVAQAPGITWSQPINLSNSPASSGRPAIVADAHGYVHVFWSEEVGGESILDQPGALIHNGNSIFYTRWDGVAWTPPIDILFVPGEVVAEYVAVTVDAADRLHAVWTGQSNFYYSSAPAWQAGSAQSWSRPVVVAIESARSQWESSIVVDTQGNVHIIYATGGSAPGVYHIRSSDMGLTWEAPTRLSEALDPLEKSFGNAMLISDGVDRLHAVWQTIEKEGYGQGVYYASSADGGDGWTIPVRMAYRDPGEYGVGFPYIVSIGESELHLIYIDGTWHVGRWHRISRDGGETWSEPQHILQNLEGINGYTIMLVDDSEELHLLTTMRTLAQVGGLFYAYWTGEEWSPEQLAIPDTLETGPGAHWTAATMRLGNEMHVVWNTNFSMKAGEIWHARGRLPGADPLPTRSIPTGEAPVLAPTAVTAISTPVTVSAAPVATTGFEGQPEVRSGAPPSSSSQVIPLLIAAAPAVLLIAGVFAWTRLRSR